MRPGVTEEAEAAFQHWRGRAADGMLLLFGFSAFPPIVASLLHYDLPAGRQWLAAPILVLVLASVGIALRRSSTPLRVWLVLLVPYVASVQALIWYSAAMARVWIMGAPLVALILGGSRAAWTACFVSVGLITVHAAGALSGVTDAWRVPGLDESRPAVTLAGAAMWLAFLLPGLLLLYRVRLLLVGTVALENGIWPRVEEDVARGKEMHASRRRASAEPEQLEREIARVGEEERRRLGRELHDGVSQQLAVTLLRCAALEQRLAADYPPALAEARDIVGLLESTMDEVHEVARSLSPVGMEPESLAPALGALARRAESQFRLRCHFRQTGEVRLPNREATIDLFRIAQEAVTNAGKHAHARTIRMTLAGAGGHVVLTVEDDGDGLPSLAPSGGLGLRIMAFRAQRIGGTLTVERTPAGGTRVVCRMPQAFRQ